MFQWMTDHPYAAVLGAFILCLVVLLGITWYVIKDGDDGV